MNVKIIGASVNPQDWYGKHIGQVFEVEPLSGKYAKSHFRIVSGEFTNALIESVDCEEYKPQTGDVYKSRISSHTLQCIRLANENEFADYGDIWIGLDDQGGFGIEDVSTLNDPKEYEFLHNAPVPSDIEIKL